MAANMLPIIALGAVALLMMKKKGNGGGNGNGDGTDDGNGNGTGPGGGPSGLATYSDPDEPDAPVMMQFTPVTHTEPDAPVDPYAGKPWTFWPKPFMPEGGGVCPPGHVMVFRGIMPDDSVGLCGSEDDPSDRTWCVPPWGAVPFCSWKECEPGLTQVYVTDGNQLRKVCRNIPSA